MAKIEDDVKDLGGFLLNIVTLGGHEESKRLKIEAQELKEAAAAENAAITKAQELLQKNKDEVISQLEIDFLAAEGLITDAETLSLTELSNTEEGLLGTRDNFIEQANSVFADTDELVANELGEAGLIDEGALEALKQTKLFSDNAINILTEFTDDLTTKGDLSRTKITEASVSAIETIGEKNADAKAALEDYKEELVNTGILSREAIDTSTNEAIASVIAGNTEAIASLEGVKQGIIDSGIATREEIDNSTKEAIKSISTATDKAISALTPFQLAGTQGLERVKFLSGLLTESEAKAHVEQFGEVGTSPLFKFKLQERQKALDIRQKALGRTFSGAGAEEFRNEVDSLIAQDIQTQIDTSTGLATRGQQAATNIAGLEAQRGTDIAGLQERRGLGIAGSLEGESQRLGGINTQISNIQAGQGAQVGQLQQQRGLNTADQLIKEAGLSGDVAAKIAAIEEREGQTIAQIKQTRGAQVAASLLQQAGIEGNIANTIALIETQTGTNVSNIIGNRTIQKTNVKLGITEARQAIRNNTALNKSALKTGLSTTKGNIALGESAQQVGLIANQARQNTLNQVDLSQLNTKAATAPIRGFTELLNLGLQGFQTFNGAKTPGGAK